MDLEQARTVLLDHARRPRNPLPFGPAPSERGFEGECRNPLCGDVVRVALRIENDILENCWIEARGCTMCVAAASLMSEHIEGLTVAQTLRVRQRFLDALTATATEDWPLELAELAPLAHLRVNRARIACATIGWHALHRALAPRAERC